MVSLQLWPGQYGLYFRIKNEVEDKYLYDRKHLFLLCNLLIYNSEYARPGAWPHASPLVHALVHAPLQSGCSPTSIHFEITITVATTSAVC